MRATEAVPFDFESFFAVFDSESHSQNLTYLVRKERW